MKSSFLSGTKLCCFPTSSSSSRTKQGPQRWYISPSAKALDHIPKHFREENLKDGLMDNYKNAPQYLYGLTPSQMDMFMTEDNPVQSERVTENDKKETVGSETEAYAIADAMAFCKSDVYTVNCGMAYGQAAMLLALGTKGYRALQPNSSTKLYLPKVNRSSGSAIEMWIKAKELDANTEYYIDLLAKGTGKPKEEIAKDIERPKYFQAQEAIDYGLADKIISSREAFEKRDYDKLIAQSKANRRGPGTGTQAGPSGYR